MRHQSTWDETRWERRGYIGSASPVHRAHSRPSQSRALGVTSRWPHPSTEVGWSNDNYRTRSTFVLLSCLSCQCIFIEMTIYGDRRRSSFCLRPFRASMSDEKLPRYTGIGRYTGTCPAQVFGSALQPRAGVTGTKRYADRDPLLPPPSAAPPIASPD